MRKFSANYIEFRPVVPEMLFKDFLIFTLVAILFSRAEPFVQFW